MLNNNTTKGWMEKLEEQFLVHAQERKPIWKTNWELVGKMRHQDHSPEPRAWEISPVLYQVS